MSFWKSIQLNDRPGKGFRGFETYTYVETGPATYTVTSLGFATVDSATLSLYDSNTLDDSNTNATSIVGYTGSDASYSTTHFGNFGTTKYAADLAWASHTHNAYNDFELNGTGVANIASHGVTRIGVRADKDVSATEPTTSNYLRYNAADHADSNTHPKLIIEHSEAPMTPNMKYIHPDHLGGTNVVTDENGDVVQTLDYYPYGSQRITTGSHSEQRRFIGEEYDGDTEFSYLNARYYQGSRGQFMSQDPVFLAIGSGKQFAQSRQKLATILSDPQLLNSYSYARGNPITLSDPTGEIVPIIALAAIWTVANFTYTGIQYNIELWEAETARMYPNSFSQQEYDALQAAPGNRLEDFGAGVVASLIRSPLGVALDLAGLIEDINDEFEYYFPDAVKRREERKESMQSVSITASSNRSSRYSAPSGAGGSSQSRPGGSSTGNPGSSSRSSISTFGLTGNTEITSANVDAFKIFISQFLK
jgi:RHS repeat-associated protein